MVFLSGELALGYQYNREHRPGNNGFFFEAMLNCTFRLDTMDTLDTLDTIDTIDALGTIDTLDRGK